MCIDDGLCPNWWQTPWAEVKKEMTVEKGLDEKVADRIGEYVGLKGKLEYHEDRTWGLRTGPGWELLDKLESDSALTGIKSAREGLEDMRKLFGYLEVFGVLDKVR
jgi:histidyl-tRNA synthetase